MDYNNDIFISTGEIETGVSSEIGAISRHLGTGHVKRMQKITKINCMMSEAGCGWSQPQPKLADTTNITDISPPQYRTAVEWRDEVQHI